MKKVKFFNITGINCRYCSKICEITYRISKHFSTYKIWQEIVRSTILNNTLHKINDFLVVKAKTMLLLVKPINKKKSPYKDAFNRKELACINKKIPNRSKATEIPKVKLITLKSKYTTLTHLILGIQSIQTGFNLIEFNVSIKKQTSEPVNKKKIMAYITDIAID